MRPYLIILWPQASAKCPATLLYHGWYAHCRSWLILPTYYSITILASNELFLYNIDWLYMFDWSITWTHALLSLIGGLITWHANKLLVHLNIYACPYVDYMFRVLKLTANYMFVAVLLNTSWYYQYSHSKYEFGLFYHKSWILCLNLLTWIARATVIAGFPTTHPSFHFLQILTHIA